MGFGCSSSEDMLFDWSDFLHFPPSGSLFTHWGFLVKIDIKKSFAFASMDLAGPSAGPRTAPMALPSPAPLEIHSERQGGGRLLLDGFASPLQGFVHPSGYECVSGLFVLFAIFDVNSVMEF